MTIANLDVTALFPYPGELASRPLDGVRAPSAAESVSGPSSGRSGQQVATQTVAVSPASLAESVQQLNAGLMSFGVEFEFSETDNRLITRVIDSSTGELIRQIPSEEVLRMARSLEQTSGVLLQTTA